MHIPDHSVRSHYVPTHLVRAKIAEARARGLLDDPRSDETRVLAELERILIGLAHAADRKESLRLRAQLAVQERCLAGVLERMGQSVLAQSLWEASPSYDSL